MLFNPLNMKDEILLQKSYKWNETFPAHLFYNEIKVYIQKQMMSVKFRHILLFSYKVPIPIYAFLSALQDLKNALAIEVHSSSLQPAGTNFPISENFHHLLDRMVPHSKLRCNFSECYPSVFSDELVGFLLVAQLQ
jgi:hypothetical protein